MKKLFIILLAVVAFSIIIVYPINLRLACQEGLTLWYQSVLPALLPFVIIAALLEKTNFYDWVANNKIFQHILLPILSLLGLLMGFPIGARLVHDCTTKKLCSLETAQRMLPCCCQYSTAFLLGFVYLGFENQISMPTFLLLIYLPHGLLALIFVLENLLKNGKNNTEISKKEPTSNLQINMQIIDAGIISGFESLIKLCGYIVFFTITANYIKEITCNSYAQLLLLPFCEVTTGIKNIQTYSLPRSLQLYFVAITLAFGSLSGLVQCQSVIADTELSIRTYFLHRCILVILSILTISVYLCI